MAQAGENDDGQRFRFHGSGIGAPVAGAMIRETATRIGRMIPLKTALAVVAVCFAVRENFPFSHFPMYSSFSDYSYYVYIADARDEPVPIQSLSGHKTSALKKIYDGQLADERARLEEAGVTVDGFRFMTDVQRRPAGEYTLRWIYDNAKRERKAELDALRPLRLYQVHLRYEDGETVEEKALIAEVP